MSVSVQELDNTVRAFFEGKGDVVSAFQSTLENDETANRAQQKQAQQTLTEVSSPRSRRDLVATHTAPNSSSKTPMPGSP